LLLVVVAFGAYFFTYINKREHQLAEHHLRLLQNAGDYISDALDGMNGSVQGAVTLGGDELKQAADSIRKDESASDKWRAVFGLKLDLIQWLKSRPDLAEPGREAQFPSLDSLASQSLPIVHDSTVFVRVAAVLD